jgi:hypothetical protein
VAAPAVHGETEALSAQLISPFNVYFNTQLIFRHFQLWRLFTNFLFFGSLGAWRALGSVLSCRVSRRPTQAWTSSSTCSS